MDKLEDLKFGLTINTSTGIIMKESCSVTFWILFFFTDLYIIVFFSKDRTFQNTKEMYIIASSCLKIPLYQLIRTHFCILSRLEWLSEQRLSVVSRCGVFKMFQFSWRVLLCKFIKNVSVVSCHVIPLWLLISWVGFRHFSDIFLYVFGGLFFSRSRISNFLGVNLSIKQFVYYDFISPQLRLLSPGLTQGSLTFALNFVAHQKVNF